MTSTAALSEREKKKMHERHEKILEEMMQDESNRFCADCGQKGTRWASWNLGVFLCIRCGGIHRKLGTHISRIKSITLDTWTPEQIASIQEKGNSKVNVIYNPHPDRHPAPNNDIDMEQYIRDKYERKRFVESSGSGSNGSGSNGTGSNGTGSNGTGSSNTGYNPAANNKGSVGFTSASSAISASDEVKYGAEIRKLRDMGFSDTVAVINALKRTHGDIQKSLDILVMNSDGPNRSSSNNSSNISAAEQSSISRLKAMGFTDENACLSALRKSKGKIEDAVQELIANAPPSPLVTNSNSKTATAPTSAPMDDLLSLDFGGGSSGFNSNPNPNPNSNNPFDIGGSTILSATTNSNPFGVGTSNPFSNSSTTDSNASKANAILSLYSQQPPQQSAFSSNPFASFPGNQASPFAALSNGNTNAIGSNNAFGSQPFGATTNGNTFAIMSQNAKPNTNNASFGSNVNNSINPFGTMPNNVQVNNPFGTMPNNVQVNNPFGTMPNNVQVNPVNNPFSNFSSASNPPVQSIQAFPPSFAAQPVNNSNNVFGNGSSPFSALSAPANSLPRQFGTNPFGSTVAASNQQVSSFPTVPANNNDPFASLKQQSFGTQNNKTATPNAIPVNPFSVPNSNNNNNNNNASVGNFTNSNNNNPFF